MHLDEILKNRSKSLGQEGHGSVKFFCKAAMASILQLPRGEEALVGETPSPVHCELCTNGRGGRNGSCFIP